MNKENFQTSLIVPSSIALAFIRLPIQIDLFLLSQEKCVEPLGFENGEIKDGELTASSAWMGVSTFGPQQARLHNKKWPQGWSADLTDKQPWLKVSLQSDYVITGIATQGYGNPVFREWIESYDLVWLDTKAGEVFYHEDGKVKVGVFSIFVSLLTLSNFARPRFNLKGQ